VTLPSVAQNEFEEWVNRLVDKHFGNRFQKLADEVGVTFSALKRSVRNGSTSIETLLRLCLATGEPPEDVFTRAGKRHVHDLITQLYGAGSTFRGSARARAVAQAFDAVADEGAKAFYAESLKALAAHQPPRAQSDGTSAAKTSAARDTPRTRGTRSRRA
jgi:transcriptional regulator with XRE-family HTH domain